eukprot:945935-Pleurochrysis_carterae.AAC.2
MAWAGRVDAAARLSLSGASTSMRCTFMRCSRTRCALAICQTCASGRSSAGAASREFVCRACCKQMGACHQGHAQPSRQ